MSADDLSVYSALCDVVVMCYRPTLPVDFPMHTVDGVSLIVRCLTPFVACGFRRFYIVHSDQKILGVIRAAFPASALNGRPLQLLLVSSAADTTQKQTLRDMIASRDGANRKRDIVYTDCTMFLSESDLLALVTNFYASFSSAAMLLWKATVPEVKNAPRGAKPPAPNVDQASLALVALEDECPSELVIGGTSDAVGAEHYRVHFASREAKEVPQLQMGFVSRRPNLEFRYDLCDAGTYIVQPWLFGVVTAEVEDEGYEASIRDDLYDIARYQHCAINRRAGNASADARHCSTPADLIKAYYEGSVRPVEVAPVVHWARAPCAAEGQFYSREFNAAQDVLPATWDCVRVTAAVVTSARDASVRVANIKRLAASSE